MQSAPRLRLDRHRWRLLTALFVLCGCDDSSNSPTQADDHGSSGDVADAGTAEPDDFESRIKSLELMPQDAAALQRWKDATEFQLHYDASACFGTCPEYDLTIDQAGHMHFSGTSYVARPGTYDVSIAPDDARALYAQVLDLHFLQLQDSYVSAADGCLLVTDHPTYQMALSTPEEEKKVVYYTGCFIKGPAHDALTAIVNEISGFSVVERFTTPKPQNCRDTNGFYAALVDEREVPSFVLYSGDAAKPVGILKASPPNQMSHFRSEVIVLDCSGKELLKSNNVQRYGCGASILPQAAATFMWPGVDQGIHAALLADANSDSQSSEEYEVKLLDVDTDISQRLRRGTSCN